ncbi:glucan endo-1,3-beta-D-glucosidase [Tamlana sedimentorum]|uniref:Glucan endo-1,3-beta-D-glucosidase n=1 Tax=Neotamlana sedimentorum TaxID=1435349 RepID=A0A0D7WCA2_9FLAO|nr:family 16 glycosylhydrolase [Tamlana sedimentorum]KJD36719.1 glucan endo-1,3-beta-D-glucosidase [Tamlana sedimentorum]
MKNIKYKITIILSLALVVFNCQEDDATIGDITAPNTVEITAEIVGADTDNPDGDGSGFVNLIATANNAVSYKFDFGDGLSEVAPSGVVTHRFTNVGTNTYTVVVNAIGTGGLSSSTAMEITVRSDFDDPELKQLLSGGSSKTWYLASSEAAHLGVGPGNIGVDAEGFWYPKWYAAQPFEKCEDDISACLCDDELTFTLDANGQLTYELDNNGFTFFNAGHQGIVGENAGEDACFAYDTSGAKIVSLAPSLTDWTTVPDPDFAARGTAMNIAEGGFMGYYVGSSVYDVISVSDTELYVRTLDANDSGLAWYHKFQTSPADNTFETVFTNLVWQDEFDIPGTPDATKWTYDLGAGGWGNNEVQTYTNNVENVIVEDGLLKITARADGSGGYTSARLKSQDLQEFTYGRVEVRAKLPAAQGTWPAIWMLGANFDTVGWPTCGEIDIMEQTGQDKFNTSAALHFPGNSAGDAITEETSNETSTTEFHNYTVEWTSTAIKVLVDDTVFLSWANTSDSAFNADFFMILNVAMGGTLGGTIDPAFTQDTMEIDYVRVYQ